MRTLKQVSWIVNLGRFGSAADHGDSEEESLDS